MDADGILPRSASVPVMTLRFSCEGEGGQVDEVNPELVDVPMANQVAPFSLDVGDTHDETIAVDTSSALDGQYVSAVLTASGIVSSFTTVEIIGGGVSAYVNSPPSAVSIDGAFADWAGKISADQDSSIVDDIDTDIDAVGGVSTTLHSSFYVSVEG